MTKEQLREDVKYIRKNCPWGGLYLLAFCAAIGTCANSYRLDAIEQKQSTLETTCNENDILHIEDVTGGAEEDVYLEAEDGKRWFLYVDGKPVTQQPEEFSDVEQIL